MSIYAEHKYTELHARSLERRLETEALTPEERKKLAKELEDTRWEARLLWRDMVQEARQEEDERWRDLGACDAEATDNDE